MLNLDLRMKCVELLATFMYKGFLPVIEDALIPPKQATLTSPNSAMLNFIINELNNSQVF